MNDHQVAVLLVDDGSSVIYRYEEILRRNGYHIHKTASCRDYLSQGDNWGKIGLIIAPDREISRISLDVRYSFLVIGILTGGPDQGPCPEDIYGCLDAESSEPVIISTVKKGLREFLGYDRRGLSGEDETYRDLINGMNESVWVISLEGPIINVNDKAVSLLGYSREELKRLGLSHVDHYLSVDEILALRKKIPEQKIQMFETVHTTRDGREIPVEVSSSIIKYEGEDAILSIARDISERKETEKILREQLEKDELVVKAMHHRIKNNLATVSNLLSLQSRISTNLEAKSVLQEAVARLQSISLLYNKLLETGNFKGLSITGYFRGIITSLLEIYPEKGNVSVDWEVEDIILDEKHLFPLGVIVDELITNIFKYGFPDDREGRIVFSVKQRDGEILLRILNDGIPFPDESVLSEKKGFGLMIVRLLCKQIGGAYRMYKDESTVQEITFPLDKEISGQ